MFMAPAKFCRQNANWRNFVNAHLPLTNVILCLCLLEPGFWVCELFETEKAEEKNRKWKFWLWCFQSFGYSWVRAGMCTIVRCSANRPQLGELHWYFHLLLCNRLKQLTYLKLISSNIQCNVNIKANFNLT